MLLEAAFSHFGFSADNGRGKPGFFRDVIDRKVVKGPFVSTFSAQDTVVGGPYSIMSRLAGDNTREIGDASDEYGGIGRNGPLKTTEVVTGKLQRGGHRVRLPGRRHQQSRWVWRVDQGPRRRDQRRHHLRVRVGGRAHMSPGRFRHWLAGTVAALLAAFVWACTGTDQPARHRHRVQVRNRRHRGDRRRAVLALDGAARGLRRQAAEPAGQRLRAAGVHLRNPHQRPADRGVDGAAACSRASV